MKRKTTTTNVNSSTHFPKSITHLPHAMQFLVRNSHARRSAINRSIANMRTCALCNMYLRKRIIRRKTAATTWYGTPKGSMANLRRASTTNRSKTTKAMRVCCWSCERQHNQPQQIIRRAITRKTSMHALKTFTRPQQTRIAKWINTLHNAQAHVPDLIQHNHPFALHQMHQLHASTTHTRRKCMATKSKRQITQIRQIDKDRQNKYNFSQTYPKHTRQK